MAGLLVIASNAGPSRAVSSRRPADLVQARDSKTTCIYVGGGSVEPQLARAEHATGLTWDCLEVFSNPVPYWSRWVDPWFTHADSGVPAWISKHRDERTLIVSEDLIPNSVTNDPDPLTWEQPCDQGQYDQYATALARALVRAGESYSVIRLGVEANGGWEIDYVGQTVQEQADWAQCYDNEVTAMRAVPGEHFLFVWNPNTCTNDLGLANWYPGNSYVDIIGADAYDVDCTTLKTVAQEGWAAYYIDSNPGNDASLSAIESFAVAHGKPLAIPEWGENVANPDDPAYVRGIASVVENDDVSFQSYFDCGCDSIQQLGSAEPLSTAAYTAAFGPRTKGHRRS